MSTTSAPPAPAAPAAPATPPPSAPAAPSPAPAATNEFDSAWDKLEPKTPAPKEEPKAPEPKAAPAKPPEEPAKTSPAPPKPDATAPKQLREQLEKTSGELKASKDQIMALEKRIAEAEAKGKDTTALSEQLAKEQKEKQELMAELRGLRQESSPEFKEKHEKPFNQAADYAKSVVEGLTIYEQDGQGGEVTRPAKWEDFVALYQMPKSKALPLIAKMFKESGPVVAQELMGLQKLDQQRQAAIQEERSSFAAKEKERQAESAKQREFVEATWTKVNADIAGKSEFFQPDPNDAEATRLLDEGFKLADAQPASLQERIVHDAQLRNRAAAHSRMKYEVTKAREKIKELEATIAEMKGSEPGGVQRPGGHTPPPAEKDWKTDLRESGAINQA